MAKLVDLAAQVQPQRRPRREYTRRGAKLVEQTPVPADDYEQPVPAPANGNGHALVEERIVTRVVERPVLPPDDPRNPRIAAALADLAVLLEDADGPAKGWPVLPSRAGLGAAVRAFTRAREDFEGDRMLLRVAATAVAYLAKRQEDRCREYSSPGLSKPLV